jgi:alpha-tubulin suppressor-like RCC1 family protein
MSPRIVSNATSWTSRRQQRSFDGNSSLYGLAGLPANFYSQVFNDVTTGSNGLNTTAGYDLATGLGTPTCNLLNQVASTTPLVPIGTAIPTPQVPVTMAIDYGCALQSGRVECWGGNVAGQLGNGGTASTTVATCALLSDGSVWCWGQNDYGQLGVGSINTGSTSPVQVQLPSGFFATSLGVGPWFACAVGQTGSVMCWGKNEQGQLGSTTSPLCAGIQCAPTPQQVQSVVGATSVSAGDAFACAVLMGGAVDCWGADDTGQIGNGTFSATPLPPTRVAGIASAQAISAGVGYACALSATGSVSCWGANDAGQLGNGNTTTSATPQATPFSGVKYVAAGFYHTCVVDQAGAAACVGDNNAQDLGNAGISGPQTFPVTVMGLPFPATGVASGNQATCAIMAEGSSGQPVACWGSGASGQLGDGSTADSPGVPVDVALRQCP